MPDNEAEEAEEAEERAVELARALVWARSGRGRAARQAAGVFLKLVAEVVGRDVCTVNQYELGNLRPTGDPGIAWLRFMEKLEAVVASEMENAPGGTGALPTRRSTPAARVPDDNVPRR